MECQTYPHQRASAISEREAPAGHRMKEKKEDLQDSEDVQTKDSSPTKS